MSTLHKRKYTKEYCTSVARQCSSLAEFYKIYPYVANASYRYGYLSEFTWLERVNKLVWNHDTCYEEAKKYTTLKDFRKHSRGAYQNAWGHKWLKEYTWLKRLDTPKQHWNYDTCLECAKKCTSRSQLAHDYRSAYHVAWENNWLDDYTWLQTPKKDVYYT